MTENQYEIPGQVRDVAEKAVEQAKKAFEGFMEQANKAVSAAEVQATAMQAGSKDFNAKALSFAESNVASTFDFMQKLMHAKDVNEVVRLQTDYMQEQMKAFGEQTKELGAAATKAMTELAKPRF